MRGYISKLSDKVALTIITVHPDSSVTLVSNAVVPHAFLRLKPLGYGQHDDEGVELSTAA